MPSRSPASRWSKEHGGKGSTVRRERGGKIRYNTLAPAQERAAAQPGCEAYECRWGENYRDGETAELHWHVGRMKTKEQER